VRSFQPRDIGHRALGRRGHVGAEFGIELLDAAVEKFRDLAWFEFLLRDELAQLPCFDIGIQHLGVLASNAVPHPNEFCQWHRL
jgi:hypothetical protein